MEKNSEAEKAVKRREKLFITCIIVFVISAINFILALHGVYE